jgi:hypothetical protein
MPSGNILTAADVLNLLVIGIDKTTLETELTVSVWISTLARGGSKSGGGKIWTSPNNQSSLRIMTKPDGSSYARVYIQWLRRWRTGRTTPKRIRTTWNSWRNSPDGVVTPSDLE